MPKEKKAINSGMMQRTKEVKAPVFAILVKSIDQSIKKVKAAGGKLIAPKMEIGGMGYYVYVMDTEGNVVDLWEPMTQTGKQTEMKKKKKA